MLKQAIRMANLETGELDNQAVIIGCLDSTRVHANSNV